MTKKFKFMKAVSLTMVGMMVLASSVSVTHASEIGSGSSGISIGSGSSNDLILTLEQMSSVKYGESDNKDYTNFVTGDYKISVEGEMFTFDQLNLTEYDLTSYTTNALEELTGNELYFLKSTYDYILEFGCSYEGELFYTYTGKQLTALELDHYVYSLISECVNRDSSKANEYAKYYAELVGVRECIFNFSQVSSSFREEQEATINDIYWSRDSKYNKFKQ